MIEGTPDEGTPGDPVSGRDPGRRSTQAGRSPVELLLEVEVAAEPERVWAVLTQVRDWPRWHPHMTFAVARGDLAEGTRLDWRADGMRIRSVIQELDPLERFGLSTRMLGGHGRLRWVLEEVAPARTRIRFEESWEGLLVRLLQRTLHRTLTLSRTAWLEALRDRAEEAPPRRRPAE